MTTFAVEPGQVEFSAAEQRMVDKVTGLHPSELSMHEAQMALSTTFLVYRSYMQRGLERDLQQLSTNPKTAEAQIAESITKIFGLFLPMWVQLATPVIAAGYLHGLKQSKYKVPPDTMLEMAQTFAAETGMYLNQTSSESLLLGFGSMVNRKVAPKQALTNVVDAFGVNTRTMNTLVNVYTAKEPERATSTIPTETFKAQRARLLVAAGIKTRAVTVGENEVWTAKEQIKETALSLAIENGAIPRGTSRVWVTAKDELVCTHCGPLHKKKVKVGQGFEVPGKGFFRHPPVHVNCRCQVLPAFSLRSFIGKADNDWETQPRQRSGRFGARPPGTKAKEADFDLGRLMDEALIRSAQQPAPEAEPEDNTQQMLDILGIPAEETEEKKPVTRKRVTRKGVTSARLTSEGVTLNSSRVTDTNRKVTRTGHSLVNRAPVTARHQKRLTAASQVKLNRLMTEAGIVIPGEIVDPVNVQKPDRIPKGATDVGQPMYAIMDGTHVSIKNGMVDVSGIVVDSNPANLVQELKDYLAEKDAEEVTEILSNRNRFQQVKLSDYHQRKNPWRVIDINETLVTDLIAYERSRQSHGEYGKVMDDVTLPVSIIAPIGQDGKELRGGPTSDPDDQIDLTHEYDEVDQDYISASSMVEMLRIDDYVEHSHPRLISVQVVPGAHDTDSDDFPYASPGANYKAAKPADYKRIGDYRYYVHELDPDW